MIKFPGTHGHLIECLAVIFTYPGQPDRIIDIAGAFNFSDREAERGMLWSVSKLICQPDEGMGPEFWTYAKAWYSDIGGRRLARIGAGAYGDTTVLTRSLIAPEPAVAKGRGFLSQVDR